MTDDVYKDLTYKEQKVLRLLAEGKTYDQMAAILSIPRDTVKSRVQRMLRKFWVEKSEELVVKLERMGYLPTLRYRLEEKDEQLSYGSVETYKAVASSYGYGQDKDRFYRRLMHDQDPSSDLYKRFIHEVEVLSRVDHHNILGLLEFGWYEEQCPFFTMPYHANLVDIIEACSSSPKKIDNILLQLLNVLAYLHWRGIIFNNLGLENIRVTEDGRVFLINFGDSLLLEQMQSESKISSKREADSAPETLPGGAVSVQSDLWALGILMYQVLTRGQHPFGTQPPTPEKLAHAINELRHNDSVDEAMTEIVEKLLSFESEGGYQSALEVTKALLRSRGGRFDPGHAFSKYFPGFDKIELFGRDDVLDQIKSTLRQLVEERQGGMRLIVGEAGVGKSVLIDQLMREAWRYPGVIVSYAKAEQRADDRGYMMWRDVLSKLIEVAEPTGAVAHATRNLQTLLHPKGKTASMEEEDSGSTSHAALRLFRLLQAENKTKKGLKNKQKTNRGLKDKVVLLLLDDLQWMGKDSFRLLEALNNLSLPVLIIGSCLWPDPRAKLTPIVISDKLKLSEKHIIKVENLNDAKLELCRRLLSAFHLSQILSPDQIHDATRKISDECKGNPQLMKKCIERCASLDWSDSIAELDRILPSGDEISGYIIKWLKRFDTSTQSFLTMCALVGRKFDLEVLRRIYEDQDEHRLEDLLFECSKEGILVEIDSKQREFEHESVYNAARKLLPNKAESLYEKAALAIEETYPNYTAYAAQLAELWEKAGNLEKAANYYLQAANFELSKSAYHATKELVESISYSDWQTELKPLKLAEIKLIQYFAYMGLGEVDLALDSARNALDVLGYEIVLGSHFRLPLIKASLRQILYRLREGKSNQKKTIARDEFLVAVRCYRALAQLEYFNNNFWRALYYMMEGLNLCDEMDDDNGGGQKADIYAAGTVIVSQLGPGILRNVIASQYEELAQNDLDKSGDKTLELWMRLVLGMYYSSIGKWNDAKKHLERGMQLGKERIDQRRRYEIVAILYLRCWYCGEWEEGRSRNDSLRELVRGDKLSSDSLSQTDLWPELFDGDKYLYTGEFKQDDIPLEKLCLKLAKVDQAAWLRGIGVLAQIYLRRRERIQAEKTADDFFNSVRHRPVMPFYATEGFFGALEVYLELLQHDANSKGLRKKIKKLLYYLLDQRILAFSKRYPIAKPRSLLYRARYVLITTSRKDKAKRLANLALKSAQDLKMPYDEGLILEFIGTYLYDGNSGRDRLEKAHEIFEKLGATWDRDRVGERLK